MVPLILLYPNFWLIPLFLEPSYCSLPNSWKSFPILNQTFPKQILLIFWMLYIFKAVGGGGNGVLVDTELKLFTVC